MSKRLTALSIFVLALLAPAASAQCPGRDDLSGPCWQQTTPNLPTFPQISLEGTGICWDNCTPTQVCNKVSLGVPAPSGVCAQYLVPLSLVDCAGEAQYVGVVTLDYTRTWAETTPAAATLQVWRFVAKVDVRLGTGISDACMVPACLGRQPTAFYYGYVDYALDCSTGAFEASLALFHNCDIFIHGPLSKTAGVYHPDLSYAIVAPSTAANPFVAAVASPPVGALVSEAVRQVPPPGVSCMFEDPVTSGDLKFLGAGCGCTFASTPPQLTARGLTGTGTCSAAAVGPTSFFSVNAMPNFPWYHMMTNAIGNWTTAASFPGEEAVWVDEVPLLYRDGCDAVAYGEVYYGASTAAGYPITPATDGPLTDRFLDLAANTSWVAGKKPPATFMGCVLPTRNLIYLNN